MYVDNHKTNQTVEFVEWRLEIRGHAQCKHFEEHLDNKNREEKDFRVIWKCDSMSKLSIH